MVAGRFNEDALPDLAVANRSGNSISVLLNNGGRSFKPAVEYPATSPAGLKRADFNGDGIADLAAENTGNYGGVTVMLGRGDGTFHGNFGVSAEYCVSMTPGDFDGDGLADLATAKGTGVIGVHLNQGGAIFKFPRESPALASIVFMEAADCDGDGKLDIVAGDLNSRTLVIYRGKGDGTLERDKAFEFSQPPTFIRTADLDGDTRLDIVASSYGDPSAWVLHGKGAGDFEQPMSFLSGTYPASIALADFNRDGKLDLAAANSFNESVTIMRAKGDRSFDLSAPHTVGGWPTSIAAEDFDADGTVDVAVANDRTAYAAGAVSIAWGKGNGELDAPRQIARDHAATWLEPRDIDKDGKIDLVLQSNGIEFAYGSGTGAFTNAQWFPIGYLTTGRFVTEDFNSDGILDVAVPTMTLPVPPFILYSSYSASVMLGGTNGEWWVRGAAPLDSPASLLASADFNHDSKPDLAVAFQQEKKITVYLGKGDGNFQIGLDYPQPELVFSMAIADLNGDTHPDLALGVGSQTRLLLGSETGRFAPGLVALPFWSPAFADLNGDGKLDSVGVASASNLIVCLGKNDATFTVQSEISFPAYNARPILADLNRDGKSDLLVESSAGITVYIGKGDGSFERHSHHPLGERPGSLSIADVNSDGRPDLIAMSGLQQRRISILENACLTSAPRLSIARQAGRVVLSWAKASPASEVQFSNDLASNSWESLAEVPTPSGELLELPVPIGTGKRYYRLKQRAD